MKLTPGRVLAISAVGVLSLVAVLAWMSSRPQWRQGEPLEPGMSGELRLAPSAAEMATDMPMGVIDSNVVTLGNVRAEAQKLLVDNAVQTAFLQTLEIPAQAGVKLTEQNKLMGLLGLPNTTGIITTSATIIMGVDLAGSTKVDVAQDGDTVVVTYTVASATFKDAVIDPGATQIAALDENGVIKQFFNLNELSAQSLVVAQQMAIEGMRAYACNPANGVLDRSSQSAMQTMNDVLKNTQVFKNYRVVVQAAAPHCQDES